MVSQEAINWGQNIDERRCALLQVGNNLWQLLCIGVATLQPLLCKKELSRTSLFPLGSTHKIDSSNESSKESCEKGRSSPWLWIQIYSRLKLIILVSPVLWYEILLWNLKFTFNISLSYGRPMSIANNIIYSQMEKKSISFCNLLLVFLPLTHL